MDEMAAGRPALAVSIWTVCGTVQVSDGSTTVLRTQYRAQL